MKEITYLFAEGHPSAELKHGIIASCVRIFLGLSCPTMRFLEKPHNIEQIKVVRAHYCAQQREGAKQLNKHCQRNYLRARSARLRKAYHWRSCRFSFLPIILLSS